MMKWDFVLTDGEELEATEDSPNYVIYSTVLWYHYSSECYLLCIRTHLVKLWLFFIFKTQLHSKFKSG